MEYKDKEKRKVPMPFSMKLIIGFLIFLSVAFLITTIFKFNPERSGEITGIILLVSSAFMFGYFMISKLLKWKKTNKKKRFFILE